MFSASRDFTGAMERKCGAQDHATSSKQTLRFGPCSLFMLSAKMISENDRDNKIARSLIVDWRQEERMYSCVKRNSREAEQREHIQTLL